MDKNDALINKNSENRNQLNIFGLSYFRPNEKWNISAGASLSKVNYKLTDQFPENGDQSGTRNFPVIFSPRVGVNYAPNHQIAFYASAGHGFSMPSPEETLLPEGDINKDIRPEQGIQTEIGVRMNLFGGKTLLDAAVYQINLTNLLVTKRLTEDIFTGELAGRLAGESSATGSGYLRRIAASSAVASNARISPTREGARVRRAVDSTP